MGWVRRCTNVHNRSDVQFKVPANQHWLAAQIIKDLGSDEQVRRSPIADLLRMRCWGTILKDATIWIHFNKRLTSLKSWTTYLNRGQPPSSNSELDSIHPQINKTVWSKDLYIYDSYSISDSYSSSNYSSISNLLSLSFNNYDLPTNALAYV